MTYKDLAKEWLLEEKDLCEPPSEHDQRGCDDCQRRNIVIEFATWLDENGHYGGISIDAVKHCKKDKPREHEWKNNGLGLVLCNMCGVWQTNGSYIPPCQPKPAPVCILNEDGCCDKCHNAPYGHHFHNLRSK